MMLRETPLGGGDGIVEPSELQRRINLNERGFGQAMVGRLLKACLEREIVPMLGVKTNKLLRADNRIIGVEAECNGEQVTFTARRGVIIATGGFEWDDEKRQAFL